MDGKIKESPIASIVQEISDDLSDLESNIAILEDRISGVLGKPEDSEGLPESKTKQSSPCWILEVLQSQDIRIKMLSTIIKNITKRCQL